MRTTTALLSAALLASLVGIACVEASDGGEPTQARAAEFEPTKTKLPEAATTPAPKLAAPQLATPPQTRPAPLPAAASTQAGQAGRAWQPWLDAELARISSEAPEWLAQVMTAEPKLARTGFWRLVGPALEDPNAAPVLLHRYLIADEAPQVRAAVIAALVRTDGDYAGILAELFASEADALVRVAMVSSLRRAPEPDALAVIELGFADADPQVRVAAAVVAGRHPQGAALEAPLIAALEDLPEVRLVAARSLGYLRVEAATPALTEQLASPDPALRLASLQAIDRIDPAAAEGLALLSALVDDDDPKVARAAQRIAGR